MEGTLYKWTNYISGWKERLFAIKGPILYYFYEKGGKPRGKIHLGISTITAEEGSLYFDINTGSNIFYIQAKDEETRDKWLQAIKQGIHEGQQQIKSSNTNLLNTSNNFQIKPNSEKILKIADKLTQNNADLINTLYKQNISDSSIADIIENNRKDIEEIYALYDTNYEPNLNKSTKLLRSIKNKNKQEKYSQNKITGNTIKVDDEELYEISDGEESIDDNQDDYSENQTKFKQKMKQQSQLSLINNINPETLMDSKIKYDFNLKTGNEFYDPLYDYTKREKLPFEQKEISFNIWNILKNAIGKDMNKFGLPVFFNEPLSENQRLCENFQYVDLLNNASIEPNPYLRLAYCGIFCIAGFSVDTNRKTKFFNPLLFETYEYVDNQRNFRFFSEQVSHHPAITACYVEGKNWSFYTNLHAQINLRITGKIDINALGRAYISFKNFNENVIYSKPMCVVRNLIFGKLTLDMDGKFEVKNDKGDVAEIEMIPMTSGTLGNLKGVVRDINGNEYIGISGNWLKDIKVKNLKTKEEKIVWKFSDVYPKSMYYFPKFSCDLNNLTEDMKSALMPTDSRFRPDQRLLEMQKIDEAGDEKNRLEVKQRAARAKFKKDNIIPRPRYFEETYDDITGELIYIYKGNYFEDRKNKKFENCPDIF